MHFPPEARRALGVTEYDVHDVTKPGERQDGIHAALPYCMSVIECRDFDGYRVPLTLIGPKGTGKTTLAKRHRQVLMDLPHGMVSMTSGTSPSAFNGRPRMADDGTQALRDGAGIQVARRGRSGKARSTPAGCGEARAAGDAKGDTVISQFVQIYGDGGVFLFDEMDAADANLLLGVNAAIANNVFANPATGETDRAVTRTSSPSLA